MRVVSTFHPPSSVSASVACRLIEGKPDLFLVVAKSNRLEVSLVHPEGLRFQCSLNIWGRVSAVKALPTESASNLLVMTEHPEPLLLFIKYSHSEPKSNRTTLNVFAHIALSERSSRPAEFVHDLIVHPNGTVAVASCYVGKLKVIPLKNGNLRKASVEFDVSIPELNLLSLAFVPTPLDDEDSYTIALLHFDHHQRFQLLTRNLSLADLEAAPSFVLKSTVLPSSSNFSINDPASVPKIIAISPTDPGSDAMEVDNGADDGTDDWASVVNQGGLLVIGGSVIHFYALYPNLVVAKQKTRKWRNDGTDGENDIDDGHRWKTEDNDKRLRRDNKSRKSSRKVSWPYGEVTSFCAVDEEGIRFLLSDNSGRLTMLSLDIHHTTELILVPLGVTSVATTITPLSSQALFIGSHTGDSQLVRLHTGLHAAYFHPSLEIPEDLLSFAITSSELAKRPNVTKEAGRAKGKARDTGAARGTGILIKPEGDHLEVMDAFTNLAPILDAVIADLDKNGQPQIVVCSGSQNTGALKVVRTGADFHEMAFVSGSSNFTALWSLRGRYNDPYDQFLATSNVRETRIYRLHPTRILEPVECPASSGFISNVPSLSFGNICPLIDSVYVQDSEYVVQVVSTQVSLLKWEEVSGGFTCIGDAWSPGHEEEQRKRIVAADINASQVVLGLSGGSVIVLSSNGGCFNMTASRDFFNGDEGTNEIASISCRQLDIVPLFTTRIVVSFWRTNRVEVLNLDTKDCNGKLLATVSVVVTPSLPTSVLFYNFGQGHRLKNNPDCRASLLIGQSDGSLIIHEVKDVGLGEKKVHQLGSTPVYLTPFGEKRILASGSRASVVFEKDGRTQLSPIGLKNVMAASSLETSTFLSSLVLNTPEGLIIGNLKELNKMHISSMSFGFDNPRLITYQPEIGAFGVGFVSNKPSRINEYTEKTSSFCLLDQTSFELLARFDCNNDEEVTSAQNLRLDIGAESVSFIGVGVVRIQLEEVEPSTGRFIVFKAERDFSSSGATLREVASVKLKGCPYAIALHGNSIAVAVNSAVTFYQLRRPNDGFLLVDTEYNLIQVAEWNHNYTVGHLVASEGRLILGDVIHSISVIKINNDGKVQTIGRDYSPLWPVAIESLGNGAVIAANSDCNLFTFVLDEVDGGLRKMLRRKGEYYIDDLVNKFLPGTLSPSKVQHSEIKPEQLFFTSTGRIGVIMDVSEKLSLDLFALQRNMGYYIKGPGEIPHARWRAPVGRGARSDAQMTSTGFLDGDFLERFLDYGPNSEEASQIHRGKSEAENMTIPVVDIQKALEALQSMH